MKKRAQTTLIIVVVICILAVGGILAYILIKPVKPDFVCGDKFCDKDAGENIKNCQKDCSEIIPNLCGDGVCQLKEKTNPALCPEDCDDEPISNFCGDGNCDEDETCSSCSKDCDCPVESGESHFGVQLGNLNYNSAVSHIRDLGEQLYARNVVFGDAFGWKTIKGTQENIALCRSCCDSTRSACNCMAGDKYYCTPSSRDSLLNYPMVIDFYNNNLNQLVNFEAGRYDDTVPNELTPDYPHGHEDIYRDYVSFLVQNFGDKVKYWVVGNEVEGIVFWVGTPEEYADMVVIASNEIKENCADCKVGVSFAHPDVSSKRPEQREQWYSAIGNVCNSFDFIDAHFYDTSFIEEGQLDRWKQTCPGKEFISTETGIPDTMITKTTQTQNAGGTLEKQAQDLIKYNTLLFAEGYSKIYMYLMDTEYGMGDIFLHNGLIDDVDNSRKPAFASYKIMIEKVDYFTDIEKLKDGQYKYSFADKDPVYVLWCDSQPCSSHSSIPTTNIRITNYQGNSQSEITLTESPVFVEEI